MKNSVLFSSVFMLFGFAAISQTEVVSSKNKLNAYENVYASNEKYVSDIKPYKNVNTNNSLKLGKNEATYATHKQFLSDFGDLKVTRAKKSNQFETITFLNKEGAAVNAYYDSNAQLIGTTTAKVFENLPANAQATISKNYADYKIAEIIFFDNNLQYADADNYFVQLERGNKIIVVKVDQSGSVTFFKNIR